MHTAYDAPTRHRVGDGGRAELRAVCVKLTPELHAALVARARSDDRTASAVIRRALSWYPGEAPETAR